MASSVSRSVGRTAARHLRADVLKGTLTLSDEHRTSRLRCHSFIHALLRKDPPNLERGLIVQKELSKMLFAGVRVHPRTTNTAMSYLSHIVENNPLLEPQAQSSNSDSLNKPSIVQLDPSGVVDPAARAGLQLFLDARKTFHRRYYSLYAHLIHMLLLNNQPLVACLVFDSLAHEEYLRRVVLPRDILEAQFGETTDVRNTKLNELTKRWDHLQAEHWSMSRATLRRILRFLEKLYFKTQWVQPDIHSSRIAIQGAMILTTTMQQSPLPSERELELLDFLRRLHHAMSRNDDETPDHDDKVVVPSAYVLIDSRPVLVSPKSYIGAILKYHPPQSSPNRADHTEEARRKTQQFVPKPNPSYYGSKVKTRYVCTEAVPSPLFLPSTYFYFSLLCRVQVGATWDLPTPANPRETSTNHDAQ
ncbi:hypothetical protein H0H93_010111 [Arthromyces matolae]|nr:hypothetical protein H0H93_010111 [Arthromyces matolae]